ncbi:MAG TPA: SPOR domain-containing protein [Candidatus Binatia bacterium]|jgi:DedD protein
MAENRREKDKRYYFTRGQMALLGGAFTLASIIIFALGMFVGKEIEARKTVQPEEPLVKVPVKPAPQGAAGTEGAKSKDDLTFYNTLTKTPEAKQAAETKAEEKKAEKTAKAAESRAEKAQAAAEPEIKAQAMESGETKTNDMGWSVQAHSYPDAKSATDLVDRLKNKGYNAFVTEANVKGKVWYRVRVGRFGSREEAEKTAAALRSNESLDKAFATRK